MRAIPLDLGGRAYLSVRWEEGALSAERLAVFVPSRPHHLLSIVCQCDGCLSSRGVGAHAWVVRFCQPSVHSPSWSLLPIVEDPGWAPNLHIL